MYGLPWTALAINFRQCPRDFSAGGFAGKPVINGLCVPARGYDFGGAKFGEMLSESRFAESNGFDQRANRLLALDQLAQNR